MIVLKYLPQIRGSFMFRAVLLPAILTISGCSVGAPVTEGPKPAASTAPSQASSMSPAPPQASSEPPPAGEVQAVSVSHPSVEAADAMAKCQIGDTIPIDEVIGMGEIAAAKDIVHYVPLTGREPQLREDGPAWIIQIHGDLSMPLSGEVWTDPTCVVTPNDFGYYRTGPVRNIATGAITTPEPPAELPDRVLPPLAP